MSGGRREPGFGDTPDLFRDSPPPVLQPEGGNNAFFLDPERARLLDMLTHLSQFSAQVLLVTAAEAGGKTALLDHFALRASGQRPLCRLQGSSSQEAGSLFLQIAQCFGLNPAKLGGDNAVASLSAHLAGLAAEQTPLLLVDDAQALSDDALEIILQLAGLVSAEGERLLHVVLFAEPELLQRFETPRFAALETPHRLELPPLDEAQTEAFVRHLIAKQPAQLRNEPEPTVLKRIYRESGGLPGEILRLFEEPAPTRSGLNLKALPQLPLRYLLPAAIALALLLALLLQSWLGGLFEEEAPTTSMAELPLPEAPPVAAPPPQVLPGTEEPRPEPPPVEAPGSDEAAPMEDAPPPPQVEPSRPLVAGTPEEKPASAPVVTEPEPPTEPPEAEPPVEAEPAQSPAPKLSAITPSPVTGSDRPQTLTLEGSGFDPDSRVTLYWAERQKTLAPHQVEVVDGQTLRITITTGTEPLRWAAEVVNPDGRHSARASFQVQPPAPPKPRTTTTAHGAKWLAAQPADQFTLQLLATHQADGPRDYLKHQPLPGPNAIVGVYRDSERLHLLLHGRYSSRKAAQLAIADLPPTVQQASPWIRRIGDIQTQLKATAPPSPKANKATVQDEAWIWSQDPRRFTVQLLAATNRQSVQRFVAEQSKLRPLALFTTRRDGQLWQTVIWGNFPDREAAEAALQQLPAALGQPWIRSFALIHEELTLHGGP